MTRQKGYCWEKFPLKESTQNENIPCWVNNWMKSIYTISMRKKIHRTLCQRSLFWPIKTSPKVLNGNSLRKNSFKTYDWSKLKNKQITVNITTRFKWVPNYFFCFCYLWDNLAYQKPHEIVQNTRRFFKGCVSTDHTDLMRILVQHIWLMRIRIYGIWDWDPESTIQNMEKTYPGSKGHKSMRIPDPQPVLRIRIRDGSKAF